MAIKESFFIVLTPVSNETRVAQRGKPQPNNKLHGAQPGAAIGHKLSSPPCPLRPLCPPVPPNRRKTRRIWLIVVQPPGSPLCAGFAHNGVEVPSAVLFRFFFAFYSILSTCHP